MFPKIRIVQVKDLPIKIVNEILQFDIEVQVDSILNNSLLLKNSTSNFTQLLQTKFSIEKLTKKLGNWYELEYGEFLKELDKYNKGLQPLCYNEIIRTSRMDAIL